MIRYFCLKEDIKLPKISEEKIDLLKKEFKEENLSYAIKEINSSSAGGSDNITIRMVTCMKKSQKEYKKYQGKNYSD